MPNWGTMAKWYYLPFLCLIAVAYNLTLDIVTSNDMPLSRA
jgi:hypothetical protein